MILGGGQLLVKLCLIGRCKFAEESLVLLGRCPPWGEGGVVSELGRVVTSVPFGTAPDQGQMKCIRRCSQKQEQLPAGFLSLAIG